MSSLTIGPRLQLQGRLILSIILSLGLLLLGFLQTESSAAAAGRAGIRVVNYVTWWSLDPSGYHPAILLKLENASGRDLTAQLIRFQGRFMDLRTTMVTVARDQQQRQFVPRQHILVWLKGPEAFELGLNANQWPNMECKVMARIGDVDDAGTQTLVITNVDRVVMSDDDAHQQLEKLREYTQSVSSGQYDEHNDIEHPLKLSRPAEKQNTAETVLSRHRLPGLAADFHNFEQTYGLPKGVEAGATGWTWARYQHEEPHFTVYAGSRGHSGKVDVLVVTIPGANALNDNSVLAAAGNLGGTLKGVKFGRLSHSVRYLPAGRTHLAQASAAGLRLSYVSSGASRQDGISLLLISRVPGSISAFLSEQAKKSVMLKPLSPFFAL